MVHEDDALLSLMTEFDEETFIQNRRREGYEEGVQQNRLDTAKNALKMGLSNEQIMQLTELSIEEVEKLAAQPAG